VIGVVLAAGRGERMHPLSAERPKALLPTLDVPQLSWALAGLKAAGVRRAWVNARETCGAGGVPGPPGDAAGICREVERAAAALDLDVRVSLEPEEPLGTAGALGRLRAELDETFLLVNADVASSVPLDRLVEAHRASGAPATLVGIPTGDRADLVAEDGWVVQLADRGRRPGPGHVYAGIGVFEPAVLDHVPDGVSHLFDTVMCGLVRDAGDRGIAVFEWVGFWSDLADPEAYLRVNLEALRGALAGTPPQAEALRPAEGGPLGSMPPEWHGALGSAAPHWRGPVGVPELQGLTQRWDELAYVGPGAEVEGVDLVHAVVGAGARIRPGTRLERCVVWDGAEVEAGRFADAVLTPRGVVSVAEAAEDPAARDRAGRRTR
jgi:NDP-sugar pyrophosphorylase family protein